MKYLDEIAKTAEYLRMALPMMSKQSAGLHPVSYSVWYEVVSGINPLLKAAVEEISERGHVLDEDTTHSLYRQHIAEIDVETAKRITAEFQRVMTNMAKSASEVGHQTSRFGLSLDKWSEGVIEHGESPAVQAIMGPVQAETHKMHEVVTSLQDRLAESQREIERLKVEVTRALTESVIDGMTGLTNRKGFDQALVECLNSSGKEQPQRYPSIILADIDHFKKVNDTYGHMFGDKVIRALAEVLKQNIKGKDTAARYGGEEFIILLPDTPLKGAVALAESIRLTIEGSRIRRAQTAETVANFTVSFGVACYQPGESTTEFVGRADQALYESKHQGRNRVSVAL